MKINKYSLEIGGDQFLKRKESIFQLSFWGDVSLRGGECYRWGATTRWELGHERKRCHIIHELATWITVYPNVSRYTDILSKYVESYVGWFPSTSRIYIYGKCLTLVWNIEVFIISESLIFTWRNSQNLFVKIHSINKTTFPPGKLAQSCPRHMPSTPPSQELLRRGIASAQEASCGHRRTSSQKELGPRGVEGDWRALEDV